MEVRVVSSFYLYAHIQTYQNYISVFIRRAIAKNEISCALSILLPEKIRWYNK